MSDLQKYNPEQLMNKLMSHDFPEVLEKYSAEDLENNLAVYINELILHDFNKLVSLLYRIDINESKLKNLLQTNPDTDAGIMIAKMIIDRQLQKIELRKSFKSERESDEERW